VSGADAAPTSGLPLAWRLAAWPLAVLGYLLVRGLAATWRFEVVGGREHLEALIGRPRPVLPCGWHHELLPLCAWILEGPLRGALKPTFLISRSRDGELVSRVLRLWGGATVRGSSSRGGREALRALERAVRRDAASPVMLPDGPRGPARRFKPGALVLARVTRAPILGLGCSPSGAWRLRSWDRLLVPWPFARIRVVVGEPVEPPREMTPAEQDAALARVERLLDDAERLAIG
jgi:lysophospholipid acyltransferase (LPLAT)-like uncharacterized protein